MEPVTEIKRRGRPRNPLGNINDIQNREMKQAKNRQWYYEKGFLINSIKHLVTKYHVDMVDCSFVLDYNRKSQEELKGTLQMLINWILEHRKDSFFPSEPIPKQNNNLSDDL